MDQPINTGEPGTTFISGLPEQAIKTEPQVKLAFGSEPKPTSSAAGAPPVNPSPFTIKE